MSFPMAHGVKSFQDNTVFCSRKKCITASGCRCPKRRCHRLANSTVLVEVDSASGEGRGVPRSHKLFVQEDRRNLRTSLPC